MHAEVDRSSDVANVTYIHVNLKLKKLLTIKSNIGLHHYLFYDKIYVCTIFYKINFLILNN